MNKKVFTYKSKKLKLKQRHMTKWGNLFLLEPENESPRTYTEICLLLLLNSNLNYYFKAQFIANTQDLESIKTNRKIIIVFEKDS